MLQLLCEKVKRRGGKLITNKGFSINCFTFGRVFGSFPLSDIYIWGILHPDSSRCGFDIFFTNIFMQKKKKNQLSNVNINATWWDWQCIQRNTNLWGTRSKQPKHDQQQFIQPYLLQTMTMSKYLSVSMCFPGSKDWFKSFHGISIDWHPKKCSLLISGNTLCLQCISPGVVVTEFAQRLYANHPENPTFSSFEVKYCSTFQEYYLCRV